jgi:hypothetical protein
MSLEERVNRQNSLSAGYDLGTLPCKDWSKRRFFPSSFAGQENRSSSLDLNPTPAVIRKTSGKKRSTAICRNTDCLCNPSNVLFELHYVSGAVVLLYLLKKVNYTNLIKPFFNTYYNVFRPVSWPSSVTDVSGRDLFFMHWSLIQ